MKKRRKHKKCLNCGQNLHDSHNYCSNCGQENTDNEVGVGLLLREFTSNFLSLDSRFGRTFKPFLFRPGKVTNAFNAGKRVYYANPIRWYLVISIFHFFFFIKIIDPSETKGRSMVLGNNPGDLTDAQFDSLYNLPDSLYNMVDDWPVPDHYFSMIDHLNKADELNASEIMDSLKLNSLPYDRRLGAKQIVKINHESAGSILLYIMKQIPVIMFFILPIHAFILKLFYWRKGLYIKHLIHSLHIHSFVFFVMGVAWILQLIIGDALEDIAGTIGVLISMVYIVISFKKVYKIRWFWSIVRFFLIGFIYSIVLTFAMAAGFVISLALF